MTASKKTSPSVGGTGERAFPPGRNKIVDSFVSLLERKSFNEITTAEIAGNAGVTEALIYKYFDDKRDLLHKVLGEYLVKYLVQFELDLKGIKGALNKLRKLIWSHINVYSTNKVFAKILLLEVRNSPDYYLSETYELVKQYSNVVLDIIVEGVAGGEIRDDIPPELMRQVILGSIEHVCLRDVVFRREILPDNLIDDLCNFIFNGIERRPTA